MKLQTQRLPRLATLSAIVLLLTTATVVTVNAVFWDDSPFNLSLSAYVREDENVALAVHNDEVSVIWAGNAVAPGLTLARSTSSDWLRTPIALPAGAMARYPRIAYGNGRLMASWIQDETAQPSKIIQQDVASGPPQVVIDNVYGLSAPVMAAGTAGMHMTFAAASKASANADLYYAYRPYNRADWPPPQLLVDRSKVVAPGTTGGVFSPRIAVDLLRDHIHVVWEQEQTQIVGTQILVNYSVWYVSRQGSSGMWSSPTLISPIDQDAVRPDIAVDPNGNVHVTWTQLIVGSSGVTEPDAQHVYYRKLSDPGTKAVRLNSQSLHANNIRPQRVVSTIAVEGDTVCVAWHGFNDALETSKEEIITRCSNNNGVTWQTVSNTSESAPWPSIFPAIGIDSTGGIHTAWTELELQDDSFVPHAIYYRTGSVHSASNANGVYLPFVVNNKR